MKNIVISLLTLTIYSVTFASSNHVGMIVKKQGAVELLINPSKKADGAGYVLFEKQFYKLKKVRLGTKVTNGSILRTGKGAKVKIVYKNGDQMNIDEGTAYQVMWSSKKVKGKNPGVINLLYGSIRGVVNKKGPRNGVKIKTKQAVMGVRGTDFHVGQQGTSGKSTLTVLRGKVEMSDLKNKRKKVSVAQGFSAELKPSKTKKASKDNNAKLQVSKTTKNALVKIQKVSSIKQSQKDLKQASKKLKNQIAKLEKTAVENTLSDIKEYDTKLYESLKNKNINDADKINTAVVGKIFKKAPVKKAKIDIDEDELEEDAYEKYFKIDS